MAAMTARYDEKMKDLLAENLAFFQGNAGALMARYDVLRSAAADARPAEVAAHLTGAAPSVDRNRQIVLHVQVTDDDDDDDAERIEGSNDGNEGALCCSDDDCSGCDTDSDASDASSQAIGEVVSTAPAPWLPDNAVLRQHYGGLSKEVFSLITCLEGLQDWVVVHTPRYANEDQLPMEVYSSVAGEIVECIQALDSVYSTEGHYLASRMELENSIRKHPDVQSFRDGIINVEVEAWEALSRAFRVCVQVVASVDAIIAKNFTMLSQHAAKAFEEAGDEEEESLLDQSGLFM
jgi:hypothetical protein